MEKRGEAVWLQLIKKVRDADHYLKILQRQQPKLEFKTFKIEKLYPALALQIYHQLKDKYQVTGELEVLEQEWHEQQKRLYVWFIVIYTYFFARQDPELKNIDFQSISLAFFGKKVIFLQFQFLSLIKATVKRLWSEELDNLLIESRKLFPDGQWYQVAKRIFTITNKAVFITPKHCRERWLNHLDNNKIRGSWDRQEDYLILQCVLEKYGKKWSKMISVLGNRRTEHMIKNRYNSIITRNKSHKLEKPITTANNVFQKLKKRREEGRLYDEDSSEVLMDSKKQIKNQQLYLKQQNVSAQNNQQNEYQHGQKIQQNSIQNCRGKVDQQMVLKQEESQKEVVGQHKSDEDNKKQLQLKEQFIDQVANYQHCPFQYGQFGQYGYNYENSIYKQFIPYLPHTVKLEDNATIPQTQPQTISQLYAPFHPYYDYNTNIINNMYSFQNRPANCHDSPHQPPKQPPRQ